MTEIWNLSKHEIGNWKTHYPDGHRNKFDYATTLLYHRLAKLDDHVQKDIIVIEAYLVVTGELAYVGELGLAYPEEFNRGTIYINSLATQFLLVDQQREHLIVFDNHGNVLQQKDFTYHYSQDIDEVHTDYYPAYRKIVAETEIKLQPANKDNITWILPQLLNNQDYDLAVAYLKDYQPASSIDPQYQQELQQFMHPGWFKKPDPQHLKNILNLLTT